MKYLIYFFFTENSRSLFTSANYYYILINNKKMRSSEILILALLCFTVFSWTNSCPGFYQGDKLQTGKFTFMAGRSGSSQYNYEFPIAFSAGSSGYEIAATAGTIGDYNPSNGGFSFQVNGVRKGNSNFAYFTLIAPSQGWTTIQISFLISSRDDFAVGNYQFPVNQWGSSRSTDTYDLALPINKNLPNGDYDVAAFISGFSTSTNQFQISINQKSYDVWNRKLTITIYCGANPRPASITISYVVYPRNHPILQISFGAPSGETGAYQISGPTSFQTSSNVDYSEFRVANRYLTCTGNQCDNTCTLKERCVELGGNVYQGQCIFCAVGIVFEYGLCTRRCGANQIYINRVCVCSSGFTRRGKDCVSNSGPSCVGNDYIWGNGCKTCPAGSSVVSDRKGCVCNSGSNWDANSNACQFTCSNVQNWDNGVNRCVCRPGFGRYGGRCVQCPSGASSNNREECVCSSGYTYNSGSNVCALFCPNGYIFNNQCRACPNGAFPSSDQSTCNCPNGYSFNVQTGVCQLINNCPAGFVPTPQGCVCPSGTYLYNRQCRSCPSGSSSSADQSSCNCPSGYSFNPQTATCNFVNNCPAGFIPSGPNCVCPAGSIVFNRQCRACPAGSRPNSAQSTCTCDRSDQTYDITNNRCNTQVVCSPGYVLQGGNCVCNGYVINRVCKPCPSNSVINYARNTCDCPAGYAFDLNNGICQTTCKTNELWSSSGCFCVSGYARYNGVCRQCPRSSNPTANQATCVCTSATAIYVANSNLCIECGANSSPNAQKTACVCNNGFVQQGSSCVPNVQCEFNEDFVNGQCQCKYGWIRLGPQCVQACAFGQYFDGKNCICKQGHARINGVCRPCPPRTVPNPAKTTCLCEDPLQFFTQSTLSCSNCPAFSSPNQDDTDCICFPGYNKQGAQCVSSCPADATPNQNGVCVCSGGKVLSGNVCIAPVVCPDRSTFNTATKSCVCNSRNENIINGQCQACGQNSVWSKDQCVCSTGFFKIAGVCRTCDPRTKYDGKDCICNLGYFGNRDLCTPCHKSCSQCTGPEANKCTSCSDVSLVLEKGYCAKNSPCDYGFFQDGASCTKCLDNCISCASVFECATCAIGFKENPQTVAGQKVVSCDEICGDGIKYEQQCDDGNNRDGDGCSSKCEQEKGWFCSGGSSSNPSICKKFIPDQVQFSTRGAVNLGGYVLVGVRATYLPSCISQNECSTCFKVIKANVISVNVPVNVVVNFVPLSQWQWVIKVDFLGLIVTSTFKMVIKLNDEFKGCIAAEDYDNQLEITVDPAFLAKSDKVDTLTLDDLDPNKITVPNDAKRLLGL